jgi:hypothetical protein
MEVLFEYSQTHHFRNYIKCIPEKAAKFLPVTLKKMVGPPGLEPGTDGL